MQIIKGKKKIRGVIYLLLCLLTVFVCWLFVGRNGVFGAKVDWISQHSVIPDYFRQQFYDTGELFPEFAANLGGGQNIYNFSYYGLYSPVILLSYLLPFVKMSDYIIAVSVTGIALSVCLLYYWLGRRRFPEEIRLGVALMYMLAGPVIYQSCHQVMFVNYMPFLYMSLIGVDRYFDKKRSDLYLISVFLMIMTSFYFSIGGMLALVLYGVYRYLEITPKFRVPAFLRDGVRFVMPMLAAVCMSGILLVPTARALFGRKQKADGMKIGELLIPQFPPLRVAYGTYGLGLTTLAITVLIVGLTYRKWSERVLAWGCMLVISLPVFAWLLNGGLYIRDKAVIPFLPLVCYLIALYLRKNKKHEISLPVNLVAAVLTLTVIMYGYYGRNATISYEKQWQLLMLDGVITLISVAVFCWKRRIAVLIVPPLICLTLFEGVSNAYSSELIEPAEYAKVTDSRIGGTVNDILQHDSSFYRIEQMGKDTENAADLNRVWASGQWVSSLYSSAYNTEYQDFRKDTFELEQPYRNNLMQSVAKNPLYQRFMGVKYQIRQKKDGTPIVTENAGVAPVAYATDRVMTEGEYQTLAFPYNQTALMNYAVVNANSTDNAKADADDQGYKSLVEATAEKRTFTIPDMNTKQMKISTNADGNIEIKAKNKTSVNVSVPAETSAYSEATDYNLYLQFQVDNHRPNHDVAIWVNGIRNKLSSESHLYYNGNTTFTYVMTLPSDQTDLKITFGAGEYELTGVQCYTGSASAYTEDMEEEQNLYQSAFQVDRDDTKGNTIAGKIDVQNTGYFITSIPYDKNFTIYVDGKQAVPKKVNTAFLGFPIESGEHSVVIIYHASGVAAGKFLSLVGLVMMAVTFLIEKRWTKRGTY